MKVAIIGGGNMGGALAKAFVSTSVVRPHELLIIEADDKRREELKESLGCLCAESIDAQLKDFELVFLAVKPQAFSNVAPTLAEQLGSEQVLVSILAGVNLKTLGNALDGHIKLVRVMPTTPVQVGSGVSVYIVSSAVTAKEAAFLHDLLATSGLAQQVQDENLVDVATAACASGVGFVYYFIEHYMQATTALGFSEDQSAELVSHTFKGAIDLWLQGNDSPAELRKAVTSPGGTTAAGLESMQSHKVGENISHAIRAAYERAKELSEGQG